MVVVSFVAIGVGPRTVGRQNAYTIALLAALPLQAISVLLTPISRLLVLIGNALTPGRGFRNGPFASEIELREVVDLAQQRGVVADDERRMIQSVFELGDTPAREVMVPRTEMVWIENDKTAGQATSLAVRSGHSRIPVIGENVDDVVGVVYLKDLVQKTYYSTNGGRDTEVSDGDAPGGVRSGLQAARRAAARDAARPQPHGAAGRRVRCHRRPGHHRGRAGGDRRRDRRRVRHRRGRTGGRPGRQALSGVGPAAASRTSASCTTSSSTRTSTSTRSADCSPSNWAACRCRAPR